MTWETAFEEFARKSKVALFQASLWAVNTPLDKAYLFSTWLDVCLEIGDFVSPKLVYEDVLRKQPNFDESWLRIFIEDSDADENDGDDEDAEDAEEENQRQDEKRGLYPQHDDPCN